MSNCNNGLLVSLARYQALVKATEDAIGSSRDIGGFVQEVADHVIALSNSAGLAVPGGFMVARTQSGPRSEVPDVIEGFKVGNDFHQNQGGTDLIKAGQGLQESPISRSQNLQTFKRSLVRELPSSWTTQRNGFHDPGRAGYRS